MYKYVKKIKFIVNTQIYHIPQFNLYNIPSNPSHSPHLTSDPLWPTSLPSDGGWVNVEAGKLGDLFRSQLIGVSLCDAQLLEAIHLLGGGKEEEEGEEKWCVNLYKTRRQGREMCL